MGPSVVHNFYIFVKYFNRYSEVVHFLIGQTPQFSNLLLTHFQMLVYIGVERQCLADAVPSLNCLLEPRLQGVRMSFYVCLMRHHHHRREFTK